MGEGCTGFRAWSEPDEGLSNLGTPMCFSAPASVAAGFALCLAGIATLRLVRDRRDVAFALVPLLFGVQQFAEGILWWALEREEAAVAGGATTLYAIFAYLWWPVWIPAAVLAREAEVVRRRILMALLGLGLVVAATFAVSIGAGDVSARMAGASIVYDVPGPWRMPRAIAFIVATCGSLVASSRRWLVVFGVATFASALVAYGVWRESFTSIWCFFAAVLSLWVFLHFKGRSLQPRTARSSIPHG